MIFTALKVSKIYLHWTGRNDSCSKIL